MTTLDDARRLDTADPLAGFRERFALPDSVIYLDGNSLGALPKATSGRVEAVVQSEWGEDLIRAWNTRDWISAPKRLGDKIARLIGAAPGEVIAGESTSVNIFKALCACLQLTPERSVILSETGNFPTDAYMMEGLAALSGGRIRQVLVERDAIDAALTDDVAALLLTHTHYKSGQLHDMKAVTARAQALGIPVIWDLSHSAGAMPVALNDCEADFAVGCGYKYLNGGPGAPAFLFVAKRHQDRVFPVLSGWLGHARPFDFDDRYEPAAGIDRFQCGTPAILGMAALECGVDILLDADMQEIRIKSQALGDLFIEQVEDRLDGFELRSPRAAGERGSQVSFAHEHGYAIMQALIERGVIGDFRAPDILRFGFTPLYAGYADVWTAVDILADVMQSGVWQDARFNIRSAVT
ncbi:Kynureninase [Maricaulis maris MCS10]|uniref:Kynureninase n=1 Tax=Maricaulis maris (strain MCS10) TaxID=394221 RepID=Q0APM4_MARMM|nr:kynureninase [Maricaulis maris]ABI65763.1 Kynureninase [Maricaulis maris MCS10]